MWRSSWLAASRSRWWPSRCVRTRWSGRTSGAPQEGELVKKTNSSMRVKKNGAASPLIVRLDEESKAFLARAAKLRHISVSDYVRTVTVAQARREVTAANEQTIAMSPEELR